MTAPVLADRGLLAALAIAFDQVGIRDRPSKLAYAAMYFSRPVISSADFTAEEARELRKHLKRARRCNLDGGPLTAGDRNAVDAFAELLQTVDERRQATETTPSPTTCACSDGGRVGHRTACDPRGVGRYCPPAICWCGSCPWWSPAPEPNYAAAIAKLAEPTRRPR